MNFGDLESRYAHHDHRSQHDQSRTFDLPVTPLKARLAADHSPSTTSSTSDAATVIRWQTPPQFPQSSTKQLAPIRNLPPLRTPNQSSGSSSETLKAATRNPSAKRWRSDDPATDSNQYLVVRFNEEQLKTSHVKPSRRGKTVMDVDTKPPTPIDDTPYIRFALDQITRQEALQDIRRPETARSSDSYPVHRLLPDYGLGYVTSETDHGSGYMSPEREREALALVRKHRSSPRHADEHSDQGSEDGRLFAFNPTKPLTYPSNDEEVPFAPTPPLMMNADVFVPVDPPQHSKRYSDLMFIPMLLRPISTILLSVLCLVMIALLMFCAIYTMSHDGLLSWYSGIYGSRYFLFGFLPQILAAFIFLYVQELISTITRITPFTAMSTNDARYRSSALFMRLYPRTMLWPGATGSSGLNVILMCLWLSIFTIPLQSCLFAVIQVNGTWHWTAVRGVAWTLVVVYTLIMTGVVLTGVHFHKKVTGLKWDPRTLADVITLLPRSNLLKPFVGTDIMRSKEDIRLKLGLRSSRLGYWRTLNDNQGIFHCIGEEGTSVRQYTLEASGLHEKTTDFTFGQFADVEKAYAMHQSTTRYRYIPWFFKDTFVILWAVTAFVFILAIFIVSFLPATAIRKGFLPHLQAGPDRTGFSPANFLYSFVPSLLGMLLYLCFRTFDISLRVLKPYMELSQAGGATAAESLLLDYPALQSIPCSIRALTNHHYHIALTSLLSMVFILLPILAGGLFFPLTTPAGQVRMIPNLPSYYIVLTLLIVYFLGILTLIPNRYWMHLPHGATSLSEIISWVWNSQLLDDASFSTPRSRVDVEMRLTAVRARGGVNRYAFGAFRGRDGKEFLGIDRVGRKVRSKPQEDGREIAS